MPRGVPGSGPHAGRGKGKAKERKPVMHDGLKRLQRNIGYDVEDKDKGKPDEHQEEKVRQVYALIKLVESVMSQHDTTVEVKCEGAQVNSIVITRIKR